MCARLRIVLCLLPLCLSIVQCQTSNIIQAFADALQQTFTPPFLPDPVAFLPADKIIRRYGYPAETHTVETPDGYFLTIFRIPFSKQSGPNADKPKPVILILHPFFSCASDYLLLSPEKILPFKYANAGFDVWLGNFRGNKYALRNRYYPIDDRRFWNFTNDAYNKYDLPSTVNYVLNVTKQRKLNYFGFSLSGGTIFQMLSRYPEMNAKIRRITVTAPGIIIKDATSPFLVNPIPIQLIQKFYDTFFFGAFVTDEAIQPIAPFICAAYAPICYLVLKVFNEYHRGQVTKKTLVRISGQFPTYTSVLSYVQSDQYRRSGRFEAFDYGEAGNLAEYGTVTPLQYFVNRTTVPVCGLYGPGDDVVPPVDVIEALSQLPRWCNANNAAVDDPQWRHVDNIWGKDADRLVYDRSIAFSLQRGRQCSC